jgi:arsenite-transporting ATPase
VRAQITSAVQSFQSLFGGGDTAQTGSTAGLKGLLGKLDTLQTTIQRVQRTLRDQQQTQFVVVTIPAALAVAETKRLMVSLRSEGISISGLVCNQVVPTAAGDAYVGRRAKEQQRCMDKLINYAAQHAQLHVTQENALVPQQLLEVTQIPLVDTEATGVYGLKYFASLAHRRDLENETDHSKKLTIFGGKGGVGK